jgi:hypothetical protein
MATKLAEQGFMVKATISTAGGPGDQFFLVGKDTEPEALDAVFQVLGQKGSLTIGKRLSAQEITSLILEPNEVRQYAP